MNNIKSFLINTYNHLPLQKSDNITFYSFIEDFLYKYIKSISNVDEESLKGILDDGDSIQFFLGNRTNLRFRNLISKIVKDLLMVLSYCYKNDFYNANKLLFKILHTPKYSKYLVENYVNMLNFEIKSNNNINTFYRMRDIKEDEYKDINCWHIPYNLRHKAFAGRYSLLGYPCLYLADSKDTCNAELGELENEMRIVSSFTLLKQISLYDLRIPNEVKIQNATKIDLFTMLLNFPLIALCSAQSSNKGFNEEYYLPQLLLQLLLNNIDDIITLDGIIYSSVKNHGGYNIVLPASYEGNVPPTDGYSKLLQTILVQSSPDIYIRNKTNL